jgi:Lactate racemase N-terminal domain
LRHGDPLLQLVDQHFPESPGVDVAAAVAEGLERAGLRDLVRPGARVAITAGSRGIHDLPAVLAATVAAVRESGGDPFVVPCMGSHGGATAAGQRAVLAGLGVTEGAVGAEIVSTMDTVTVGQSAFGGPVWASRDAAEADGVIVVNRVKPHTDFHGEVESGLVKMLVIGAGKHAGALSAHGHTIRHGFPAVLRDHGERLLAALPVLCGIAIVEGPDERTAVLEVVRPEDFFAREHELLARAYEFLPRLPFDQLDVLVVDGLGKDASGTGMDTNVIGRVSFWGGGERPSRPRITRIFVRGLTAATHGNACGIGMADFTTARCAAEIDRAATDVNCITSNCPEDARIPIACASDREAIAAAMQTAGVHDPCAVRLAWIRDTAHLGRIAVSEALLDEVRAAETLRPAGPLFPLPYDENGDLRSPLA